MTRPDAALADVHAALAPAAACPSDSRSDNPLLSLHAHLHHQHRRVNTARTADTGMLGESCAHPRPHTRRLTAKRARSRSAVNRHGIADHHRQNHSSKEAPAAA